MPDKQSFNFKSMDWDAYIRFRPVYPDEIYSTIYAYHDSHQGGYDAAVDIGAGVGIVSAELAKKFASVTVTDPSEAYVAAARSSLGAWPPDHIEFLQTKAEDVSVATLPRREPVDLVTAAECLHWADVDAATPRIASILKPGGTFAAWLYGVRPLLAEQSGRLAEARELFYEIYKKIADRYDTQLEKQDEASSGAAMTARLDHMSLPSDAWTDVRRMHTLTEAPMVHDGWPRRASRVAASDTVDRLPSDELLSHDADYEYLEGYLVNWIPPIKVKAIAPVELAQLQQAMGGQTIRVTWPFVLVLATRKSG